MPRCPVLRVLQPSRQVLAGPSVCRLALTLLCAVAAMPAEARRIEKTIETVSLEPGEVGGLALNCLSGQVVTGGFSFDNRSFLIFSSYPASLRGWRIDFVNASAFPASGEVTLHLICD